MNGMFVRVFVFCILFTLNGSQRIDDLGDDDDGQYRGEPPTSSTPVPVYPDGVNTIPGDAGIHYPTYDSIVRTSFSCIGRDPGFYADIETRCQVWHICDVDSRMQSFLCTNGTIYNQATRVCEWWYNSNCEANDVERNYQQNKDLYKEFKDPEFVNSSPQNAPPQNKQGPGENQRRNEQNQQRTVETQRRNEQNQQRSDENQRKTHQNHHRVEGNQRRNEQQQQRSNENQRRNEQNQQRYDENQQRFDENQRRKEQPIVLNLQHKFQVSPSSGNSNQQFQDRPIQRQQPTHLPMEVLEERRQAARDQFYSVPARTLQENRIKQAPPVQQSQVPRFSEPQQQHQSAPTRPSQVNNKPQEVQSKPTPKVNPSGPVPQEQSPKQKFRHSTPRKHNVKFAMVPVYSSRQDSNDERQVPEETKQTGFNYYNNPHQYNKFETKVRETLEQNNGYLPTPKAPEPKSIETKIIPKPPQNYRPPPIFSPLPQKSRSTTTTTQSPVQLNNLQPRRIQAPLNQLPPGSTKILKNGRVVVKRRKVRKNNNNKSISTQQQQRNIDNVVSFPGNPHLETKVNEAFAKNHVPQKRCAVSGTGNSFKIIC